MQRIWMFQKMIFTVFHTNESQIHLLIITCELVPRYLMLCFCPGASVSPKHGEQCSRGQEPYLREGTRAPGKEGGEEGWSLRFRRHCCHRGPEGRQFWVPVGRDSLESAKLWPVCLTKVLKSHHPQKCPFIQCGLWLLPLQTPACSPRPNHSAF